MNNWRTLILCALFGGVHLAHAQQEIRRPAPTFRYSAAYLSTGNAFKNDQKLVVFPVEGEAFAVSLPLAVGCFAFTWDGKALYGRVRGDLGSKTITDPRTQQLCKIQFNPTRASLVSGSAGLGPIYSIAVSKREDKLVVVAGYPSGERLGCGIFEVSLSDGSRREVLFDVSCQPPDIGSQWRYLNLSPDGNHVSAYRRETVEMIDLVRGTVQRLGGGFMEAAWSPDGKWLAGLEAKWSGRTILMDSNSLQKKRTLPASQCQWSPDSRYILRDKGGTLETIEVATGRTKTIISSKDKVVEVSTAWVSSAIRP